MMPNQKWMEKNFQSVETTKIPVVASSYAHCAQPGASGNSFFLGQIQATGEIWKKANKKRLLHQNLKDVVIMISSYATRSLFMNM